jgi:hypothetical protein
MDIDAEIRRLRLRPTDRVVLSCRERLTQDTTDRLRDAFAKYSGVPNKVLVLDGGLSLAAIGTEPETSIAVLADLVS